MTLPVLLILLMNGFFATKDAAKGVTQKNTPAGVFFF